MLVVTMWWKRTRVWVLLWLCNVVMIVSFCFPHVIDMSALSICSVLRALVIVIYMCLLYVSLGSRVSPNSFGLMFMIVRSGGLFWLKPVTMVLFMLCNAVLVEW